MAENKIALIAGATGLIGGYLLEYLQNDPSYDRIILVTRRQVPVSHVKINQLVIDFERMEEELRDIYADDIYCTLGTTIGKAGSREAFFRVDHDYPFELAKAMLLNNAKKFLLVSSLGANSKSIVFYNRVKGYTEDSLRSLGYPFLYIFRPSLLLGNRHEKRTGEEIAKKTFKYLEWMFKGPFKRYKGIDAGQVARSMIKMAHSGELGTNILESDRIREA